MPEFLRLAGHPVRWRLLTVLAVGDRRVRELVEVTDQSQNLVSYHLGRLRAAGLVAARRSSFDGRDTYYRLDLDRSGQALIDAGVMLHPGLRLVAGRTTEPSEGFAARRVLFCCTGNSARSPMAAALLRHRAGPAVTTLSAGSHPKALNPVGVRVMADEYGLDISGHRPTALSEVTDQRFDAVISLCDKVREVCPEMPEHPRRIHWSIPDPAIGADTLGAGEAAAAFRRTAAELDGRIRYLRSLLAQPDTESIILEVS